MTLAPLARSGAIVLMARRRSRRRFRWFWRWWK